jgi:uncharacterized UPF0146 family protein
MTEPQNKVYRRASDWYIPFSLVASVVGTLVGVNLLITPLFTAMIDVNVKLTRLEGLTHRVEALEEKVEKMRDERNHPK